MITTIAPPASVAALTAAHQEHGDTVAFFHRADLPCAFSSSGNWHTAVRMVSHKGASIATCKEHIEDGGEAARALYRELHNQN
ncbi:hypothetical protein ACIQWY_29845 [Streptomyces albidoflavus]